MDLDGDGIPDLISGSWPGEIFFFKGQGKGQFAAPIKLRDKDDKLINPGGGVRKKFKSLFPLQVAVQVTGDATWEKTDKGAVIVYDGQRIPVPEGSNSYITGTASAVHAVDWSGGGKLDLLVGDIGGNVYLVPNEGTKQKWAFGKERHLKAGGADLRVDGDAGPFACDWDGDGKLDLLVGAGDGSVWFYRNIGTGKEPELAAGVRIVGPGDVTYGPDAPKEAKRGVRSKVCAVDWFGTGRLDLLLGDFATQKPTRPEPAPKEKAEQDKAKAELDEVMKTYQAMIGKVMGPDRPKDKVEREKAEKEFQRVAERMQALREKVPEEYESHGWVWLFRRRPPPSAGP